MFLVAGVGVFLGNRGFKHGKGRGGLGVIGIRIEYFLGR